MVTTLEDLSVELFYEIFTYFQLHEICIMFWNVSSRITAIIKYLPSISVYLGSSGMNTEVANFYYKYLSQPNLCTRLTSLCVSDTCSIGNGLWFAEHGPKFINLRYLSFIDVERSCFEMILDSLSPIDSLIMFSVHFALADCRVASTFAFVPEGAYYERIFRLFPSLRVCRLLFGRHDHHTMQSPFLGFFDRHTVPIQSKPLNLRSLTVRYCTAEYLPHLFEHLPQLEQFNCHLYNTSWSAKRHTAKHHFNKYVSLFGMIYLS